MSSGTAAAMACGPQQHPPHSVAVCVTLHSHCGVRLVLMLSCGVVGVWCCADIQLCLQVSVVTGAVSLGFMKRDMDSTAQHVAAETAESPIGASSAQARRGGFKHHLLQVPRGLSNCWAISTTHAKGCSNHCRPACTHTRHCIHCPQCFSHAYELTMH